MQAALLGFKPSRNGIESSNAKKPSNQDRSILMPSGFDASGSKSHPLRSCILGINPKGKPERIAIGFQCDGDVIIGIGMGKLGSSVHGDQGSGERLGGTSCYLNRPISSQFCRTSTVVFTTFL